MTKVKKCSQCGKEVSQGGSFCPFCGNIININGKVESRESGRCEVDDDIQKKYRNDINEKLQKQKQLEYQKEKERRAGKIHRTVWRFRFIPD